MSHPSRMLEHLEDRRLMAVGPYTLVGATVNDTAYNAQTGTLHTVFYDAETKQLKHQGFPNLPPGAFALLAQPVVIDATEGAGQYLSTALDDNGNLHVAYYDAKNGDLKYARRSAAGIWSTQIVDSKNTVGLYPSIALDHNDLPVISYYNKTGGNLKLAALRAGTWQTFNVDTNGDIGRYSSLALNLDERPLVGASRFGVAYEDSTNGDFKYADLTLSNATGSLRLTAIPVTVDASTTKGGGYVSLAFNFTNPAFSYYDAANADLKYAQRSSKGKWSTQTVAANNSQGLYTDLQFTFDTNEPAIVYYNKTSDRVVLAYRTPAKLWNFETQVTGGGRNVSAADGPVIGNNPPDLYLAYTDSAGGNLVIDTF